MTTTKELYPRLNSLVSPSGPFTFQFPSVPSKLDDSKTSLVLAPILETTTTITTTTSSSSSTSTSTTSYKIAPIERLPSELHTLIANYLPLASTITNLSWTSRRLYSSLGPTNRLLWYKILYRRLSEIPCNLSCPFIPPFAKNDDEDYYRKCLKIMCNRSGEKACQRCLLVDDGVVGGGTGAPGVVGGGGGGKHEEKGVQLVDIYVAGVYNGTWCWECAKEVYESTAIINLQTPLPSIPETLYTTIYLNNSTIPKPGYFVSRAAIAEAIKEQCPNGGYIPFNISQHAEPDIREAKPYILKTVISHYRKWYKHLHILFDPKELGKEMRKSFDIKKFKMNGDSCVQNDLVDAVFGAARRYLESKEIQNDEKRERERMEACKKFLSMFFGVPNTTEEKEFKMAVPTTRFLAFITKRFWISKMDEMGKNVSMESTSNSKNCVDDKPKRRCGFCVLAAKDGGDLVTEIYSPILMVCHMLSDHSEKMTEEWPLVPNLKKVRAIPEIKLEEKKKVIRKKIVREKKGGTLTTEKEGGGFNEEWIGDVRFLFGYGDGENADVNAQGVGGNEATDAVGEVSIVEETGTRNDPVVVE
ncbi:hypothetical protein TWF506_008053 [Arthrobotrys conoides]|uniref:F-box domain-containing protein n=1 Tax=Arthrobotrys conoides TaxID=74498 RepID=A0AAN8NDV3_9PEZI